MGCGSSTPGIDTSHMSPTAPGSGPSHGSNKNAANQQQQHRNGAPTLTTFEQAKVNATLSAAQAATTANPSTIRMVPINRPVEPREEASIRSIFEATDRDKSNDMSDEELGALFASFGFDSLDRLAIQHVAEYLRTDGWKIKQQQQQQQPQPPASNPLTSPTQATAAAATGGNLKRIDYDLFLAHWPSLLNYCERMNAALHFKPLETNVQHGGEGFETLLGPFIDAGFGDGRVLRAPSHAAPTDESAKAHPNQSCAHSSDDHVRALIDRITLICYEKGVLFRDAYFEPTAEHVAMTKGQRNAEDFARWARISNLAGAFALAAACDGVGRGVGHISSHETSGGGGSSANQQAKIAAAAANLSASAFSPSLPCMYIQGSNAADVINDNWSGTRNRYAAGIASLADRFDLLRAAIYPPHYNPAGIYGVRVRRGSEWYWVIVDDHIPIDADNVPLFLRSRTANEIWPLIIDKAFAKIKGSYEALHGSQMSLLVDPLYLLAGCQPATFLIPTTNAATVALMAANTTSSSNPMALSIMMQQQSQQQQQASLLAGSSANATPPFSDRSHYTFGLIKAFMDKDWFLVASPSNSAAVNNNASNAAAPSHLVPFLPKRKSSNANASPPATATAMNSNATTTNGGNAGADGLVLDNSYSILGYFEASSNDKENIAVPYHHHHMTAFPNNHNSDVNSVMAGSMMSASTRKMVVDVAAISPASHVIRLVKCRSPWGRIEWRGKWADTDVATWKNYPNLHKLLFKGESVSDREAKRKKRLAKAKKEAEEAHRNGKSVIHNVDGGAEDDDDDGTFWIQVEDLVARFGIIHCWGLFGSAVDAAINEKKRPTTTTASSTTNSTADGGGRPHSAAAAADSSSDDEFLVDPIGITSPTAAPSTTSTHTARMKEASRQKMERVRALLPPTIAPFAPSLQWSSTEKCWHEAVDMILAKKQLLKEFTHERSYLLTYSQQQQQQQEGGVNSDEGGGLVLDGKPVMTPFDCPQFVLEVPKQTTAARTSGGKTTLYFRARRLLLGRSGSGSPSSTNIAVATRKEEANNKKSGASPIALDGGSDSDEGAASDSDTDENNLAFIKTEVSKYYSSVAHQGSNQEGGDTDGGGASGSGDGSAPMSAEAQRLALLNAAVSAAAFANGGVGGAANASSSADGGSPYSPSSQISQFLHDDSVLLASPQTFIVKATVANSNVGLGGTMLKRPTGVNDAFGGGDGNDGDGEFLLPATERLLTIPTGRSVVGHSGGGYTKVSLPPGMYKLMVLVADHPNCPIKLTIRTRPPPTTTTTAAKTSSAGTVGGGAHNSNCANPVVLTRIAKCEGVVYTSNLHPEAIGEVIQRHTNYNKQKEDMANGLLQRAMGGGGGSNGATTTTTKNADGSVSRVTTSTVAKLTKSDGAGAGQPPHHRPVLGVSTVQTQRERFEGALVPTMPHTFTPIVNITPAALTVKHITIIAATNRPFNFASDRAGEFTVGCLKKTAPMLVSKTTVTKTSKDPKTGHDVVEEVTGSIFNWRDFAMDNHLSEAQQTLKANGGTAFDLQSQAADAANARMLNLPTSPNSTMTTNTTTTKDGNKTTTTATTVKTTTGGGSIASALTNATQNPNSAVATAASSALTPIASAASAASFGFHNITSVSYWGAGHPFAAFPFFTGEALPIISSSAANGNPVSCVMAIWSPEGRVRATV